MPTATAAEITVPLSELIISPYANGTNDPLGNANGSTSFAPGGRMLLSLIKLVSPTPACRSAASKAFSPVDASPLPDVRKNFVGSGPKNIERLLMKT